MTLKPIDILGGESVYCISQGQLKSARELAFENPQTAPVIQGEVRRLEKALSRNERAALAFVLIDRLLQASSQDSLPPGSEKSGLTQMG
jgi:hypothetical protein